MSRGRMQVALVGVAAALILIAAIVWFGVRSQSGDITTAAGLTSTSPRPPGAAGPTSTAAASPSSVVPVPDGRTGSQALTQAQADAISSALASGDTARISAQLADGVRKEFEASPGPVLAAGEALTISAADVRVTGDGRAAGLVRSQGSAGSTRWALTLRLENGRWKVLEMVKVSAP